MHEVGAGGTQQPMIPRHRGHPGPAGPGQPGPVPGFRRGQIRVRESLDPLETEPFLIDISPRKFPGGGRILHRHL